jgi:hypothetical protein
LAVPCEGFDGLRVEAKGHHGKDKEGKCFFHIIQNFV